MTKNQTEVCGGKEHDNKHRENLAWGMDLLHSNIDRRKHIYSIFNYAACRLQLAFVQCTLCLCICIAHLCTLALMRTRMCECRVEAHIQHMCIVHGVCLLSILHFDSGLLECWWRQTETDGEWRVARWENQRNL
jgi:hypothetical protein